MQPVKASVGFPPLSSSKFSMPDCLCIASIKNELASFMDYADTFGCQQEFL